jgi:hypothetical protein
MNNDRHGESCAREVGARVETSESSRAPRAAKSGCVASNPASASGPNPPRRSSRAAAEISANPPLTRDWDEYRGQLLRSFFRDAGSLAARYRVGSDDIVAHVRALCAPQIDRGNFLKPVACVADLTVATACCLGRANAWNELWIFAEPSMTRAAFSRLPETLALTWTRRYWTRLERASRAGTGGLVPYDGSRPVRLWLVENLLGVLEDERSAGRLEIRREHLGRPIPLRLVGEQLA